MRIVPHSTAGVSSLVHRFTAYCGSNQFHLQDKYEAVRLPHFFLVLHFNQVVSDAHCAPSVCLALSICEHSEYTNSEVKKLRVTMQAVPDKNNDLGRLGRAISHMRMYYAMGQYSQLQLLMFHPTNLMKDESVRCVWCFNLFI